MISCHTTTCSRDGIFASGCPSWRRSCASKMTLETPHDQAAQSVVPVQSRRIHRKKRIFHAVPRYRSLDITPLMVYIATSSSR